MKRFLISLFILALFSGAVFYIGWTQFKIKPENIGVVISKTNGIDKVPVENGKFSWHKQFLLPTNAQLKSFSIKPVNTLKTVSGAILSIYGDNTYSFDFTISLTVSPQVIPILLEENKISDSEDLSKYLTNAADTIAQLSAEYMVKRSLENPNFMPESVRRDELLRSIKIYQEYPEIDMTVFAVTKSKLPNSRTVDFVKNEISDIKESADINEDGEEL